MAGTSPRYQNFSGSFDVSSVAPALNAVQRRKSVRLFNGFLCRKVSEFLFSTAHVLGIEMYSGYAPDKNQRYAHYDRTFISYNVRLKTGTVSRQNALPTYNHRNPTMVVNVGKNFNTSDLKKLPFHFELFNTFDYPRAYFDPEIDLPGKCFISVE